MLIGGLLAALLSFGSQAPRSQPLVIRWPTSVRCARLSVQWRALGDAEEASGGVQLSVPAQVSSLRHVLEVPSGRYRLEVLAQSDTLEGVAHWEGSLELQAEALTIDLHP